MSKLIISVIVVILLIVGWSVFRSPEPVTYIADITDSVTALEAELESIQTKVDAGILSPEAAAAAQTRILDHITAINNAAASSERATLTPTQRAQLLDGLARLKNILVTYQATLAVIDESAAETDDVEETSKKRPGSGHRNTSIGTLIVDTIDAVESYAEAVIDEYEPEDTLPEETTTEEYESVVEEVSNVDETTEEVSDDSATSTPEATEDTGNSNDTMSKDGNGTSTEEDSGDTEPTDLDSGEATDETTPEEEGGSTTTSN